MMAVIYFISADNERTADAQLNYLIDHLRAQGEYEFYESLSSRRKFTRTVVRTPIVLEENTDTPSASSTYRGRLYCANRTTMAVIAWNEKDYHEISPLFDLSKNRFEISQKILAELEACAKGKKQMICDAPLMCFDLRSKTKHNNPDGCSFEEGIFKFNPPFPSIKRL